MTWLAVAIDVCRLLSLILAVWNLTWTGRGFLAVTVGRGSAVDFYRTVIFSYSIAVLSFQSGYLLEGITGPVHPRILMSTTMILIAELLAAIGNRMQVARKAEHFYHILHHLDVALAIVDLAIKKPDVAERLVCEARKELARGDECKKS